MRAMLLSNDHATEKKGGYKDAMSPVACWVKRGFDVTLSLMGLFVFSPVILVIGALIKLEDHGPAISSRNGWVIAERRLCCINSVR